MFYHAHNGSVRVGNSEMDYISFGKGKKNLIMLPGLGDGLATVRGKALLPEKIQMALPVPHGNGQAEKF